MINGKISEHGIGKTCQPGLWFIAERATSIAGDRAPDEKVWWSQIQGYRYVQQAKEMNKKMAIPEASVVFTVKIPASLITRIKKFASYKGMSISKVVSAVLEDFLAKKDHGQKERQAKISFSYDRMWEQKLSQVYYLLIPADNQIMKMDFLMMN